MSYITTEDSIGKAKDQIFDIVLHIWVILTTRSTLQSWKWQLIGMS